VADKLVRDALILLTTIDPIGAVLVFASVSQGLAARRRGELALRAVLIAGAILVGFLLLGQIALAAMHVSLYAFQLAGGIFLFLFGAQMTFGDFTPHASLEPESEHDPAVFPLAMPAIASPGALMAVVVLTDNARYSIGSQAVTALILVGILALTYLALRFTGVLLRVIGKNGAAALIRILGMILAALAVEMVLQALGPLGVLHPAAGQ
jgi:multiple antibiotic resistance protein